METGLVQQTSRGLIPSENNVPYSYEWITTKSVLEKVLFCFERHFVLLFEMYEVDLLSERNMTDNLKYT
jgi:hypothetical protein